VIAPPASEGTAALQWRAARDASGQTILTAVNTGQGYARVSAISVTLPDGSRPAITPIGQNPYVLAGAQRRWILQGHGVAAGTPLRLSVATQQGKTEYTLTP
jgi:fimbrial chaperone protein